MNAHCHVLYFVLLYYTTLCYGLRYVPEHLLRFVADSNQRRSARHVSNNRQLVIFRSYCERAKYSVIDECALIWNIFTNDVITLNYNDFVNHIKKDNTFNRCVELGVVKRVIV